MFGYTYMSTPLGELLLVGKGEQLTHVGLPKDNIAAPPRPEWHHESTVVTQAQQQLTEYFAGRRHSFDLALAPVGTEFQHRVWQQLQQIPFGSICSYGDIAVAIGRPQAVRAVGAANGYNPMPIVIPCHRVVGANGKLTGFSSGLANKAILLRAEGIKIDSQRQRVLP